LILLFVIADLEGVLDNLGQVYRLGNDQVHLQDYCPTCNRMMRGQAYYALMGKRFLPEHANIG
ncbi:MAG TPA: hypothetical protein VNE17_05520, partial [Nitrolancea sp.]|nr:hypothetical protein [Nitrolancea sp.]